MLRQKISSPRKPVLATVNTTQTILIRHKHSLVAEAERHRAASFNASQRVVASSSSSSSASVDKDIVFACFSLSTSVDRDIVSACLSIAF